MNIVKLQNELKNVPDQALIGYVQNPTGQVPTYLALAELQRRKDMREKYQQQQAPATTVADDLKQQAQPSGLAMLAKNPAQGNPTMSSAPTEPGVAGLPTGDMYQEQNFATGGIVAFGDGGHVPSFAGLTDGSYITDNIYTASPDQASAMKDVQAKIEEGKRQAAAIAIKKSQQGIPLTMDEKNLLQERGVVNAFTGPTAASPIDLPGAPTINKKPVVDIAKDTTTQDKTTTQKPYNPFEGYPGSYTPEPIKSIKEYGKDFEDYLGVDPMRQKLADRLAKMETSAAEIGRAHV